MDVQVWMASKEVAERLDVHVRTLRNWLEMFVPAHERQKNAQGHYLISESGVSILKEVKERKEAGNSSLRDIQKELVEEGKLSPDMLAMQEVAAGEEMVALGQAVPGMVELNQMDQAVSETLYLFKQELSQITAVKQMQSTILQKMTEIEEMQETLRLEMRRVSFELDLIQQSLTRRKHRQERYQSRFSLNPFRWFSRPATSAGTTHAAES
ncbi:MerR family transcriptional regulator [Brevibacillus fluminis]|uniref:MerR family transcriptional regulator n=1 Tax=Brevibacillus fluminis TaxID=511487 RepID=UPI003F8A31EC